MATLKTPAVSMASNDPNIASPSLSIIQNRPERHINLTDIDVNDYTIGWIAALPLEEMAARLVLNGEYQVLAQVPLGDINRYILGAINEHSIVLAVMPDGEYGKSSALSVATHMLRTFPNVRIGFMVGVGGGAPSRDNDVRMGDVVVSRKGDDKGGVFEFDYGKKHQAKPFETTSHLNSVPTSVMNTIAGLRSLEMSRLNRISQEINDILAQDRIASTVRADFERPDEESDLLFKSTIIHNASYVYNLYTILGAPSCLLLISMSFWIRSTPWQWVFTLLALAEAFLIGRNITDLRNILFIIVQASQDIPESEICRKFCQTSQPKTLVERAKRDPSSGSKIHYGLIGSSDQLMKDAMRRDELAREHKILCFEMEAAGLMNRFPCLIVRGICDYSDSHKNKKWQKHAALAAAVFARAVIRELPAQQTRNERRLVDAMSNVQKTMHQILSDTKQAVQGTEQVLSRTKQLTARNMRSDLVKWLGAPRPSINQNEVFEKRFKGTCHWFLRSQNFIEWKTAKRSFLWLNGKSGSGKSTLCSAVISTLEERRNSFPQDAHVIYFYFDFREPESKQSLEKMLRSLIQQLSARDDKLQGLLENFYSSHDGGNREPTILGLCKLFKEMIQKTARVHIIIDALDECTTQDDIGSTMGILSWIKDIATTCSNTRLMVTSQLLNEISSRIRAWAHPKDEIIIQSGSAEDIKTYIRTRVRDTDDFQRWKESQDAHILDEIEGTLIKEANGMFRWVVCQLDYLKKCLDADAIEKALKFLPPTLNTTYLRILNDIPTQHEEKTIRILQLLSSAKRPLTIEELVDTVAVRIDEEPYFDPKKRIPNFEDVSQFCSSLVEVAPVLKMTYINENMRFDTTTTKHGFVRLAHSSVKSFLTPAHLDHRWAQFFDSATVHASVAKTCLCYTIELGGLVSSHRYFASNFFPFREYSARNWMFHAAVVAAMDPIVHDLALKLFLHRPLAYQAWLPYSLIDYYSSVPAPLFVACRFGLMSVVRYFLDEGADPNADDGMCSLRAYSLSTFNAACAQGGKETIEMSSLKNTDFTLQERNRPCTETPMGIACRSGHYNLVSMLLNHLHKSDVGLYDWKTIYCKAFKNACHGRHQKLIQMLLTDMSLVSLWNWNKLPFNPLMLACRADYTSGLRTTLDHLNDADINQTIWSELLQEAFKSVGLFSSTRHELLEELLTQLQRIDTDRRVVEQLFLDIFKKTYGSHNSIMLQVGLHLPPNRDSHITKTLEVLFKHLPQHDVDGRIWKRINSAFMKSTRDADADNSFNKLVNSLLEKSRPSTLRTG